MMQLTFGRWLWLCLALSLVCCQAVGAEDARIGPAALDGVHLIVDTRALTLSVMRGQELLFRLENIAIGSNGPTRSKRSQDEKTPLGEFHINGIRSSERYHLFLSIDYPTMDDARRALRDERISAQEYQRLQKAWASGRTPSQTTALGGHLGIHGIGSGSIEIHRDFNWTNGCIAVTNEEIEVLAALVSPGTPVSIR
ncbi:MAG: L,D-transpeptidase [Halioglobus sp.]|nr:L,D-transpeptidase [Halioglobus sp.]